VKYSYNQINLQKPHDACGTLRFYTPNEVLASLALPPSLI